MVRLWVIVRFAAGSKPELFKQSLVLGGKWWLGRTYNEVGIMNKTVSVLLVEAAWLF